MKTLSSLDLASVIGGTGFGSLDPSKWVKPVSPLGPEQPPGPRGPILPISPTNPKNPAFA
jgi:hypothetical protein